MKKSRLLIAVLAATMFVLAAFGLIACDKDAGDLGGATPSTAGVYTITLNYGEGSGTLSTTVTANGKIVTLPTPTAPTGKKFDAWYDAATGGNKVTTSTTFSKNATIYARYTDNSTVSTEYTITFNPNGGTMTLTPPTMQTTNGKITSYPVATDPEGGKTFDGWYTAATGGTKVDTTTTFDKDTTLYAQFTGGGQQEIVGNKVYVGGNAVATFSEGTTAGYAYDYYASDVVFSTGDVVAFGLEGAAIDVVWVAQGSKLEEAGTDIDVTNNMPEVTISEGGTYTVSIKQSTSDVANNKWEIWIGVPGGGGLTEGMVATENGTQPENSEKPNIYLIKDGDRSQGYYVTYTGTNGDGYDEYSVTVTLEAGDRVSMYVPSWGDNGSGWECVKLNPYTDAAIAETSGDFIVMKEGGTFTFYFQTKWGDDRIYIGR